jgi:hypothetical protein
VAVTGWRPAGRQALLARPGIIGLIVGTQRVKMLPMLLAAARWAFPASTSPSDGPRFPRHYAPANPVKAYITIIGVQRFLRFCVPYTRGHEDAPKADCQEVREAATGTGRCSCWES